MAFIEPLDLKTLLVNHLAGNIEVFAFLAFIAISAAAGYFRMKNMIFLALIVLFNVMLADYLGGIYLIVLTITAIVIFWGIGKSMK